MILRLWLGYQWLEAGLHKVVDPKWMVTGEAVRGYWMRAAGLLPGTTRTIKYEWYETLIRWLAQSGQHVWFGKLVALGELLVGIGLILGGLTLVAAFFGALMNLNYMLAGTASTNPVMYTAAILIIIAGPAAYYWGVDRFLLRVIRVFALMRSLRRPLPA
ncbi:MAG: DoxX family membrane protein [Bacillota bacterium]